MEEIVELDSILVSEEPENTHGYALSTFIPPYRGLEVQYCVVCPRKCWLFQRGLGIEQGSDRVALGRLTHERTFQRFQMRNVLIENYLQIDFAEEGVVHEVKHSQASERAHRLQLAYYLWSLRARGIETVGILHYPRQRRREVLELTPELENELHLVLNQVEQLRTKPTPPQVERPMNLCRNCAYQEFCWCYEEETE